MKIPKIPLAGALLFSYALYSTFVPVSIPHSIILFSLAGYAAFEQYLNSHKTPSIIQSVEELKVELRKELRASEEAYELKLSLLKQEQQRTAIERANATSASSTKKSPIQF